MKTIFREKNASSGGFFRMIRWTAFLLILSVGVGLTDFPSSDSFRPLTGTAGLLYAQSESSQYQSAYDLYLKAAAVNDPAQKTQAWNSVITAFTNFIAAYPNSSKRTDAELFLGYAYLMRSGYIDASDGATGREHLNYVISKGKTKENESLYRMASLQYAYSLYSLADYPNAMTALEKFIAEFPDSGDLQYVYEYAGVCASKLGDYTKAQNYFNTCLTRFPNGELRDVCRLEAAVAKGRAGNYTEADAEFNRLASDPSYPYAQKAFLQRAYLRVLQEDYQGAITLMETFIRQNESNSANRELVIEAYGYEAFCYLRLGRYNEGLQMISRIEQMTTNLTPDIAFLKIQLLTKLERFDEADALLKQVENSVMSLSNSDVIHYYRSTILLARGQYDETIRLLLGFVDLRQNSTDRSRLDIHYFDSPSPTKKLNQRDYLNACGTLVLSYTSRYAKTRGQYASDNENQEAVYQAMNRFALSQTDPVLTKVVEKVNQERQAAMQNPIGPGNNGGGNLWGSDPGGQGGYLNPIGTGAGVGGQQLIPSGPSQPAGPSGTGGSPDSFFGPNSGQWPGGTSTNQSGNRPIGTGVTPNGYPTGNQTLGPDGRPITPTSSGTRIDEDQAKEMFRKAIDLYQGNHLEEANDELLNLLLSSETLWTDCPTVAPAAALLRANILFDLKEFNEAQMVCDLLIKNAPRSPEAVDACYFCGKRADYYGHRDKAIEYLEKGINSPHEGNFRPDSYYLLAWNEWERKNTDLAERYFAKVYRDYQNNQYWSHAAWADAQIKYQNREYVAAEKIVNDALLTGPDKAIVDRLLLLKGEIALKSRDYVKARVAYETILREYPESDCRQTARNRLENIEELGGISGQDSHPGPDDSFEEEEAGPPRRA